MDDLLRRRKGAKRPSSLRSRAMFLSRNSRLAGSLQIMRAEPAEEREAMAEQQQPNPKPERRMRRAHDTNPREDRMDDERRRQPEDCEVEPEPSDKPRYRS